MFSKFIHSPTLKTDKYNTWKKEIQVWELKTNRNNSVYLFLTLGMKSKVWELDITTLTTDDEMQKLRSATTVNFTYWSTHTQMKILTFLWNTHKNIQFILQWTYLRLVNHYQDNSRTNSKSMINKGEKTHDQHLQICVRVFRK